MTARDPESFPAPSGFDDDDIPVISAAMLHPTVDFEAAMSPVPVVSLVLMAACVAIFACEAVRGALGDPAKMIALGALSKPRVEAGEVWRLISATFLHGNLNHLAGNLVALYILGMACEHGFGRAQFLTLYVATGVVGELFSLAGTHRASVGASGAIFGLCGAVVALFWRHRHRLHLRDRRIGAILALWAGFQIVLGLTNPVVDNLAHLGGFLSGIALGFVLQPAVLDGKEAIAAMASTRVGLTLAVLALAVTAYFLIPRLVG